MRGSSSWKDLFKDAFENVRNATGRAATFLYRHSEAALFHVALFSFGMVVVVALVAIMAIYQFSIESRESAQADQTLSAEAMLQAMHDLQDREAHVDGQLALVAQLNAQYQAAASQVFAGQSLFADKEGELQKAVAHMTQSLKPVERSSIVTLLNADQSGIEGDRQLVNALTRILSKAPSAQGGTSSAEYQHVVDALTALERINIDNMKKTKAKLSASGTLSDAQQELTNARASAQIKSVLVDAYADASLTGTPSTHQIAAFDDFEAFVKLIGFFKIVLVAPFSMQTLLFTMFMGILGSVITFFRDVVDGTVKRRWIRLIYRPMLGAMLALGVYGLMKAGVVILSQSSGSESSGDALNPYFVGFLGLMSGVSSETIIDRIRKIASFTPDEKPPEATDYR